MEHIKNIIQKGLFNAIKDKINEREKLITEMWSYSDQMDNTMDYVYDILSKNIHNGEMYKLDYGIGLRRGIIENLTLFGIDDITFEYYIYECRDDETCRYIINNAFSENISERDIDKSKTNLYAIKEGLSRLASYLYTQHYLHRWFDNRLA